MLCNEQQIDLGGVLISHIALGQTGNQDMLRQEGVSSKFHNFAYTKLLAFCLFAHAIVVTKNWL